MDNETKITEINSDISRDFKKILIVDDLTYVVETIKKILTEAGYFILTAKTGNEAIRKMREYLPDLVTIDQKLPDMFGTQLVQKIREIPECSNVKIIFISAIYDVDEIKNILKLGISDYLIKPFKKNKLLETVSKILN